MPKRTATQKHIDNINSYIKKVGSFFGTNSPEYRAITNQLTAFDTVNYKNSDVIQIRNTKANRKQHQKIRALDKNKPSFARQKRRYQKIIDDLKNGGVDTPDIDRPETGGIGAPDTPDIDRPVISFEDWFNGWRQTWNDAEQYEIAELANQLGVPFDYNEWYADYGYREQIRHDLYNAWLDDIVNEINGTDTVDEFTVDSDSGEMFDYNNDDIDGGNIYD